MAEEGKVCTKCGEWKPLTEFYTAKRKNGAGRRSLARCKVCVNAQNEARRQKNLERDLAQKRAYAKDHSTEAVTRVREWRNLPGNAERKNAGERERRKRPETATKIKEYAKEYARRPEVRAARNAARKLRRSTDPEFVKKEREAQKAYYQRPEIIERERPKRKKIYGSAEHKEKFNARRRERYATDPLFLCRNKMSGMVRRVAQKLSRKKDVRTSDALGYTADQLRQRLECQFSSGMSWANYGDWHIDHKKPIAAFLEQGITDPRTINALCNLQPMWGEENQKKSSSWTPLIAANDNKKDVANVA